MPTATISTRGIQGESLNAATDRLVNTILLSEGVVDKAGNSYQVLQNTGSDMNVKVGSGTAFDRAVVQGDLSGQGVFIPEHQNATQVLAIAASDPTNPRKDIVILRVFDDTFDSSGDDFTDLEVVTGTPAGSPSEPSLPSSALKLAVVDVVANVTQIVNGDITDARSEATLLPATLPMVRARVVDFAANTISTAETVEKTVTFNIPLNWSTYDIDVFVSMGIFESGTLIGAVDVNLRIREDSVSGNIIGQALVRLETTSPDNRETLAFSGSTTGETATGSKLIHFTAQVSGNDLEMSWEDLVMIVYAWRTN